MKRERSDSPATGASAVVVIPVYKPAPTPDEARALAQIGRVLGRHPRALAVPAGLDPAPYQALLPGLRVERFDPAFFADIRGYNRLMLDDGFYARFAAWDYVLIHQLDAWVFDDRLADWCGRGYDYVGAPWLRPWHRDRKATRLRRREARVALWQCLPLDPRHPKAFYRIDGLSGNGGLSLRRVAAFRAVLAARLPVLDIFLEGGKGPTGLDLNEDIFWAGWARRGRWGPRLKRPGWREGIDFAIEHEVDFALQRLGRLPFGCHAWPLTAVAWGRVPAARELFQNVPAEG